MYSASAPLVGALITVMLSINSRLSGTVGDLVAAVVIHAAGLAAVSAVAVSAAVIARSAPSRAARIPAYYYLGGFIGVGTVLLCNYAFGAVSASLAVAMTLLGQAAFSMAADASGFLGRTRHPLSVRRAPGILLAVAGVAAMAGNWRADVAPMLAALAAGASTGLAIIVNAELGRRKGVLRSAVCNYVVGLATTIAIAAAVGPSLPEAARNIAASGPGLALGGGFIGVTVVIASNLILPRVPAFRATLLMFSGQALAGVALDFAGEGTLDWRKLAGTALVLAGLAADSFLSAAAKPRSAEGTAKRGKRQPIYETKLL